MPLPDAVRWLAAVFACYRLSQLVARDDGPYMVFKAARCNAGKRAACEQANDKKNGFWFNVAELFNCPYCLGVWFAVFCAALALRPTLTGDAVLVALAVAGAQALLQALLEGRDDGC